MPDELLAVMGMTLTKTLADYGATRVANVSMLSGSAKAGSLLKR